MFGGGGGGIFGHIQMILSFLFSSNGGVCWPHHVLVVYNHTRYSILVPVCGVNGHTNSINPQALVVSR